MTEAAFLYEPIGLREAAKFLRVRPDWLAQEASAGRIKGGKVRGKGGCWAFIRYDLLEHIRSTYQEIKPCLSKNVETSGTFTSQSRMAKSLDSALTRKTAKQLRNTMTT